MLLAISEVTQIRLILNSQIFHQKKNSQFLLLGFINLYIYSFKYQTKPTLILISDQLFEEKKLLNVTYSLVYI